MRLMRKKSNVQEKTAGYKDNQSKMKHKILCSITFDSNKDAGIALKSIKPEVIDTERAKTKMEVKNKELVAEITAEDINALHAGINSFLRLVKTIESK